MNRLEKLGFRIHEVDDKKVVYKQTSGYERIHIQIDFVSETINFWAVWEDCYKREFVDLGVPLNVLEASIELLKSGKLEITFRDE